MEVVITLAVVAVGVAIYVYGKKRAAENRKIVPPPDDYSGIGPKHL